MILVWYLKETSFTSKSTGNEAEACRSVDTQREEIITYLDLASHQTVTSNPTPLMTPQPASSLLIMNLSIQQQVANAHPPIVAPKERERLCMYCSRKDGCDGKPAWWQCQHACRDCGNRSVHGCSGRIPNKPNCGVHPLPPSARNQVLT